MPMLQVQDAGCHLDLFVFWGRLGSWSPTSPLRRKKTQCLQGRFGERCNLKRFWHGWNMINMVKRMCHFFVVFPDLEKALPMNTDDWLQSYCIISHLHFNFSNKITENYLTQKLWDTYQHPSTPINISSPATWLLQPIAEFPFCPQELAPQPQILTHKTRLFMVECFHKTDFQAFLGCLFSVRSSKILVRFVWNIFMYILQRS